MYGIATRSSTSRGCCRCTRTATLKLDELVTRRYDLDRSTRPRGHARRKNIRGVVIHSTDPDQPRPHPPLHWRPKMTATSLHGSRSRHHHPSTPSSSSTASSSTRSTAPCSTSSTPRPARSSCQRRRGQCRRRRPRRGRRPSSVRGRTLVAMNPATSGRRRSGASATSCPSTPTRSAGSRPSTRASPILSRPAATSRRRPDCSTTCRASRRSSRARRIPISAPATSTPTPARAARRRRPHRPVELPLRSRLEGRPRARGGQHRGAQARRGNAAVGAAPGRARPRGGHPAGRVQRRQRLRRDRRPALTEHPDVDKISFTGSTATGRRILDAAKGNLKRVTLELGGKSANIIFPDADLDAAIAGSVGRHLLQRRPGVRGRVPAVRPRRRVRRGHRRHGREGAADQGRRRLRPDQRDRPRREPRALRARQRLPRRSARARARS